MPIADCRDASQPDRPSRATRLQRTGTRLFIAALATGGLQAVGGGRIGTAGLGPSADSLVPAPRAGRALTYTQAAMPAMPPAVATPTPAAPQAGMAPAPVSAPPQNLPVGLPTPTPAAPSVIMQSFYASLSEGLATTLANNAYYTQQAGFAGQSFGLLITGASVACDALPSNTSLLPSPAIHICSSLASHGAGQPVVAAQIHNADQSITNATNVAFTNGQNATNIESGTVHLAATGGAAIAFNYTAASCDKLVLLPPCAPSRR